MTKKEKIYAGALLALFIVMILLEMAQPRPVNWRHTYHKNDKIPYGNYLLFSMLDADDYPNDLIEISDSYFEEKNNGYFTEQNQHLLFIGDRYAPNEQDLEILLEHVASGANAFLVSNNFPIALQDTLGFYTKADYFFQPASEDQENDKLDKEGTVPVNFSDKALKTENGYGFKRTSITFFFYQQEEKPAFKVLASNHNKKPTFIMAKFGKGNFYLHCNPLMFTNFHMLTESGSKYIASALSYLPNGTLLWDTYQQGIKQEPQTPLRFILQQVPLRWAWYLSLVLLALWIIFQSKRRQRKIPVVAPPPNATLEFVETIGKLHYQQRQHHELARKKIKFLREGLKKKYFVRQEEDKQETINKICRQSNLKEDETKKMIEFIAVLNAKEPISDLELQQLEDYTYKLMNA